MQLPPCGHLTNCSPELPDQFPGQTDIKTGRQPPLKMTTSRLQLFIVSVYTWPRNAPMSSLWFRGELGGSLWTVCDGDITRGHRSCRAV